MRNFIILLAGFAVSLLLLNACAGIAARVESVGFYDTPKGKEPASEFTRLYVYNQCYEDVRVTFPEIKGERPGERRSHRIRGRGIGSIWAGKKGSLPLAVIGKQDTPDLKYTPKEIREKAARDEWRTATAVIESYSLTLCPRETPLHDDEDNKVRPAIPGEMVDVYVFTLAEYKRYPLYIKLNGVQVRFIETGDDCKATFLLPAGTKGELKVYAPCLDDGHVTFQIGQEWEGKAVRSFYDAEHGLKKEKTRPAAKGEPVIAPPEPVTPKGSWQ